MTRFYASVLTAVALGLCTALAHAGDVKKITLAEGQVITAPILKQTETELFVDLGTTVQSIPRSRVVSIEEPEGDAIAAAGTIRAQQTDDLFSVADLPVSTVKQLSEQFGEAVVMVRTPSGLGSGFIIDARGYLVTNFHVIEGETRLSVAVFRREGESFKREIIENVKIVATNPFLDLALLKFEPPAGMEVKIVYLDREDQVREGEQVFAIGNPLGLERTVTQGTVSKNNRAFEGLAFIQTDTPINFGNSGGPLFNARGEVVGVTNMGASKMMSEGLNFAIPVRYVKDFLRNRDAFAYDTDSPNSGNIYNTPSPRIESGVPEFLRPPATDRTETPGG